MSATASGSTYHSLPLSHPKSTRVLRILPPELQDGDNITCQLEVILLGDKPPPEYYALSYVWGSPSETRCITVNKTPFFVRRNLWNFLDLMRKRQFRDLLWIDAICIDQTCIPERNHQVSVMGVIYRSATRVIVWLGPESDLISRNSCKPKQPGTGAFSFLRSAITLKNERYSQVSILHCMRLMAHDHLMELDLEGQPPEGSHGSIAFQRREIVLLLFEKMGEIFSAKYWTRIWVVQEYILAKETEILTDRSHIYGSELLEIFRKASDASDPIYKYYDYCDHHLMKTWNQVLDTTAMSIIRSQWAGTERLDKLIEEFMGLDCFDPRDHVYALLSLTNGPGGYFYAISPDYSRAKLLLYIELTYEFLGMGDFREKALVVLATVLGIEGEIAKEVEGRVRKRIERDRHSLGRPCSGREVADDVSRLLS